MALLHNYIEKNRSTFKLADMGIQQQIKIGQFSLLEKNKNENKSKVIYKVNNTI